MPQILAGAPAAQAALEKVKSEIPRAARTPLLAIVQVGNDGASSSYIRQKAKMAESHGVEFRHVHLPPSITRHELEETLDLLAEEDAIDGILLQLPLDSPVLNKPEIVNELLQRIPPNKDADGLNPVNQGHVFAGASRPGLWTAPIPCTALGVYRLLEHYNIPVVGKNVTMIGTSRLVGMPTAALLTHAGATVTLCHSRTKDLVAECQRADIIVVATGKQHLVTQKHVKKGTVVIDVGIHSLGNKKLTGDVDPECHELCAAYSPVPGGVGPMTVAMLIENTLRLYASHVSRSTPKPSL